MQLLEPGGGTLLGRLGEGSAAYKSAFERVAQWGSRSPLQSSTEDEYTIAGDASEPAPPSTSVRPRADT